MIKIRSLDLRFSWWGILVAGFYLLCFIGMLLWIFLVASKNPADSGESGILLLIFIWPWIYFVPVEWLNLFTAMALILVNASILYLIFGGLRRRKSRSGTD